MSRWESSCLRWARRHARYGRRWLLVEPHLVARASGRRQLLSMVRWRQLRCGGAGRLAPILGRGG